MENNGAKPTTSEQRIEDLAARAGNTEESVQMLAAQQRRFATWSEKQDEMNGKVLMELAAGKKASEKSADLSLRVLKTVQDMDAKWDRKHEALTGRVASLEQRADDANPPAAPPIATRAPTGSVPSIMPSLLDVGDEMSEPTKTDLLASDKDGVLAFAIKERKTVVELTAKVSALEATLAERDRQSQRVRQDRKDDNMLRLHWGKLVIGAIVTLIAGLVGGGIVSKEMFHKTPVEHPTAQEK